MLEDEGKGVLFLETCIALKKRPQTQIHVYPVPEETEEDAPMYFKQVIIML